MTPKANSPSSIELEKELQRIREQIPLLEAQVKELENRKWELIGTHSLGLIDKAKREERNNAFPVFRKRDYNSERIVSVDGKWIGIREDMKKDSDITYYSVVTGRRKNSRDDLGKIDAKLALEIWNEHEKV